MTNPADDSTPVTIFETGNPAVLAVAKSLLEEAGITFFASGEGVQDLFAGGSIGGLNPFVGPVHVQVSAEDADRARELLAELEGAEAPDR
ncbi:MAG: DUF2007 domain-containing protein [Vicinamibacterales bacterium]